MSASFYDLLKYAKTGIAAPDMTAYDKMRAVAMAGGKVKTLTGVPPLSFSANGKPLISWSILGNGQQSGTPAPDAPIMPEFVGERTWNLFDTDLTVGTINASDGTESPHDQRMRSDFISKLPAGTYSLSANGAKLVIVYLYNTKTDYYGTTNTGWSTLPYTFTTNSDFFVRIVFRDSPDHNMNLGSVSDIMLNSGSTHLPYEPYGYKLPITNAGQTVPIYLGQTQTVRRIKKLVLTGQEDFLVESELSRYSFQPTSWILSAGLRLTRFVCSHFMCIYDGRDISDVPNNSAYTGGATSNRIYIYATDFSDLAAFKQWLSDQYSAGTPVCIWYVLATPETGIVNEPLMKIGSYADELFSEDTGVSIPTARGENTLTVDTELQPSEMTITYR